MVFQSHTIFRCQMIKIYARLFKLNLNVSIAFNFIIVACHSLYAPNRQKTLLNQCSIFGRISIYIFCLHYLHLAWSEAKKEKKNGNSKCTSYENGICFTFAILYSYLCYNFCFLLFRFTLFSVIILRCADTRFERAHSTERCCKCFENKTSTNETKHKKKKSKEQKKSNTKSR